MVLYFTGTGNSRYAASLLAEALGDELVSLNELMRSGDRPALSSQKPYVICAPTHCYRLPLSLEKLLGELKFEGNQKAYFVMTCGAGTGGAASINKALCADLGLAYMGTFTLVMPDNYLVMYAPSTFEEAAEQIASCKSRMESLTECIRAEKPLKEKNIPLSGAISRAGSKLFNKFFVSADKFTVSDACISCGACVRGCPVNNIKLVDGRPVWGGDCIHCVACISACPVNAIEYGKATAGRRRYYLYPDGTQKKN